MIKSTGGRSDELSIISDFDRTLYDAFKNALERGDKNTWEQILEFIRTQLIFAIGKNSKAVMQQLNWMPSAIYNVSLVNLEISKTVAKSFGTLFNTISAYYKPFKKADDPISERPESFYMYFKTLMNFYHYAIHHPDEKTINDIIKSFNEIVDDKYDYETRFDIQRNPEASQREKKAIRDEATKRNILEVTQRQAKLTLIAWATFLYINQKLGEDRFNLLIGLFDLQYDFFEDLLLDIDYIRTNESRGFFGINFWDHLERESGRAYSPPSAYDWILYGPALLLLRNRLPHFNPDAIIDDRQHGFLYSDMRHKFHVLKAKLDKIVNVLGWAAVAGSAVEQPGGDKLKIQFDEREAEILGMFLSIKILHEEEENRQLVERSLDKTSIDKFKDTLYDRWLSSCQSYELFSNKNAIDLVDTTEGLGFHGQQILLEHQRTMFAEGEQQTIYGSNDLGAFIGRNVDEQFIYTILETSTRIRDKKSQGFDSVTSGIDKGIASLRKKGIEPDVIFVPPQFLYKSDLARAGKYIRIQAAEKSLQIGTYDGIPVFRFFAQALNSKAIVASFKKAFSLSVWGDKSLYKGVFKLELRELTQDEIDEEYKKEQSKWSINSDNAQLSEEQAKLRVAASLMLEMWTRGKFKITDPQAVTWCLFTPKALSEKNF